MIKLPDSDKVLRVQNNLLYVIAFLFPLYPLVVSALIFVFGLFSIYTVVRGYGRAQMSELSILLLLFYALHLVGMLTTENVQRGLFDLEVKLSFLVFPLAFIGFKLVDTRNFTTTLRMFFLGTLANGIICVGYAFYRYYFVEPPELQEAYIYFFSTYFSTLLHPTYYSMYVVFSLMIMTYLEWPLLDINKPWRSVINMLIIVFLSITLLLSASKTGLIMWSFLVLFGTVLMLVYVERKWIPILGVVMLTSIVGSVYQATPVIKTRVSTGLRAADSDQVNPAASESTAARMLVYKSSWELVTSQPWYGQGTGDFQDELDEVYKKNGYEMPLERHLNAHNQFLQSWIGLGIPGLVMTLGVFIVMFQQSYRNRDWLYVGFTTVFFLASLTESTFHVQAGVVFFSFFAVLFARKSLSARCSNQDMPLIKAP